MTVEQSDRPPNNNNDNDNDHHTTLQEPEDALELHEIRTEEDNPDDHDDGYAASTVTVSSGENRVVPCRTVSRTTDRSRNSASSSSKPPRKGIWGAIARFWTRNVVLTVPQKSNRDHYGTIPSTVNPHLTEEELANVIAPALERTFLSYIRTSVILSMQGVLIAQLFRLQRSISQEQSELTYFEVAIPLSVACHCVALLVVVIGAFRFWRQQSSIVSGTVHAGGWELNWTGILITAVSSGYHGDLTGCADEWVRL